jgi:hypothetical protein
MADNMQAFKEDNAFIEEDGDRDGDESTELPLTRESVTSARKTYLKGILVVGLALSAMLFGVVFLGSNNRTGLGGAEDENVRRAVLSELERNLEIVQLSANYSNLSDWVTALDSITTGKPWEQICPIYMMVTSDDPPAAREDQQLKNLQAYFASSTYKAYIRQLIRGAPNAAGKKC